MEQGWMLFAVLSLAVVSQALTPSSFLTSADRLRLKAVFESARPYQDLAAAHYSILGLKLLGEAVPNSQEACNFVKSKVDANSIESLFHASSTTKSLGNCPLSLQANSQSLLQSALTEEASVQDIFFAVSTLNNVGQRVDSAKVTKALTAALKKDDSVLSLGYAFHIASHLSGDVSSFFERIEDAIVQADEVDNKYAQFEGGLSITAIIISGAYRLGEHFKKAPTIDKEKCVKFANYFLSRKHVQVIRAAYHLLDVLNILTTNKFHNPVAITLASKTALSNQEPTVQIRITNLLGASLGPLSVTVDTAVLQGTEKTVLTKKALQPVKKDNTLYEFNFMESKPGRGFYKLSISATPTKADSRLLGNTGAPIEVKVMTEVVAESVEIGAMDLDQATTPKTTKIQYPNKLPSILEADFHQKIQMKFILLDRNAGDKMAAHQAFIRMTHEATKQEIIFVAEPDSHHVYKFDMDINAKGKDFGYLSGRYNLDLIIGDAVIANPFSWRVADVELTFSESAIPSPSHKSYYSAKSEIKHIFREPEKRPSPVVSNTFTGLVLAPLLLLIILWIKLGINVSNFHFNLGTIGFHLGLSAIFGLFVVFWLQLNMFTTLKYLGLLGIVTFLCGNSMLSKIAQARKQ